MTSDEASKGKHRLTLTRAALYIMEGALQDPGPCTTPAKVVTWAKVWNRIRSANNRMIAMPWGESYDYEKGFIRKETDSDIVWTKRTAEWAEAQKRWTEERVTIVINDKMRDTCRDTLQWVHDHRSDERVRVKLSGEHAALLLVAFDICKEEPDADFELEIDDGKPKKLKAQEVGAA